LLQLPFSNYALAEPLFSELMPLHGSVRAVLGGTAEGEVLLDSEANPTLAILRGPEGVYLAGNPTPEAAAAAREELDGWEYVIAEPRLAPRMASILPHAGMLPHQRVRLTTSPANAEVPALPDGYAYAQRDEPLAVEIIHGGQAVAQCAPDLTVGSYAEIGIHTDPAHRRKGLATAAVRATLAAAAAAGITEVGWHCLASNRGSLAVARATGFVETHRYTAYAEVLPAENAGDLPPEACRSHAERLEPGVADHVWLGFHVAGAWAQAGETERALAAVERLVASPWQGRAEWLEAHWSLAPLRTEPRFIAAVAAHRQRSTPG
jgi:RimJ/RimL family protein N-acetyltransferase